MSDQTDLKSTPQAWLVAILASVIGVGWQYGSLILIEQKVSIFPTVPDVLLQALPRIDFGLFGELWFFALLFIFAWPHFRRYRIDTPKVLTALGLYYFVRGFFMYFFPIGAPLGAIMAEGRLSLWGFENHAFFPGGHIGILTILAMQTKPSAVRRALWIGLTVFGIGTLLAKTHYTMDSVAGVLISYAVSVWVERRWTAHGAALTQSREVRRIV